LTCLTKYSPDYFSIAKCIVYLGQHSLATDILRQLVEKGDPRSLAIAYQISFDLYDNSTQEFLRKVREELPKTEDSPKSSESESHNDQMEDHNHGHSEETDQLLSELNNTLVRLRPQLRAHRIGQNPCRKNVKPRSKQFDKS
jgi:26S proteasome regulatory subunit N2